MKCKICGSKTKNWYKGLFDDRHGYPGKFAVEKCEECGFAQTNPQIPVREISKLYEKYYPRKNIDVRSIKLSDYDEKNMFRLWRKGLFTNCEYSVPLNKSHDVLDVGSGVGYSLLWLKNMKQRPYGMDPDVTGKKVAKKFKIPFHYGFIEDKPFKSKKFDYVIASQVLEHTNNPLQFVKECSTRLKDNGKLILSFPNINSLTRIMLGNKWLHWHIPYHLNHFSKEAVYKLADETELLVESIKTVTPNMWTTIQLQSLRTKPKIGKRDVFWDGGEVAATVPGWQRKLANIMEEYNYVNRLVDTLGYGESFLVILSKASKN